MPRGEPVAQRGRGPGLAIWGAFGVLCLAATLLVVWSTQDCTGLFAPTVATTPEPFPGAHAALTPLGGRECATPGGPAVGPPTGIGAGGGAAARSQVETLLDGRGYVPADDGWGAAAPLPMHGAAESLEGSCGIVAVVAEPGGYIDRWRGSDGRWRTEGCNPTYALVAACEGDRWAVEGTGHATVRSFAMPGLTASTSAHIGIDVDVLLAHAEAEAQLRALGWEPADEIVVEYVHPSGGATISERPPSAPASGCVAWVAVGRGLGSALTYWDYAPVDTEPAVGGFTVGMVSCAPDPSVTATETRLDVTDHDGGGGRIWFRPYAPASGPAVPSGTVRAPLGIARVRAVTAPPATLPATVPMRKAP